MLVSVILKVRVQSQLYFSAVTCTLLGKTPHVKPCSTPPESGCVVFLIFQTLLFLEIGGYNKQATRGQWFWGCRPWCLLTHQMCGITMILLASFYFLIRCFPSPGLVRPFYQDECKFEVLFALASKILQIFLDVWKMMTLKLLKLGIKHTKNAS